ncbi:DUF6201 family protein [Neisseriaceae bacterium ESL0693]|nr:DUF6201 family protein [Neisseriaceae bacterium ESL0693]
MIWDYFWRLLYSKPCKIIRQTLWILLLLWWLLLSHVTFSSPPEKEGDFACFFGQYRFSVESPMPVNPIGLWISLRYLGKEPFYLVVYDNQGHYIGQSSPTLCNDRYSMSIRNKTGACNMIITKKDKIIVAGAGSGLDVPLHHKKWWSWILQWVHN